MKKIYTMAVLAIAATNVAIADDSQYSKQYSTCMDKAEGVTVNMLECMGDETSRQDARLNRAYKKLWSRQTPARKKQIQSVQRLWIKYRDADCDFHHAPDSGTIELLNESGCQLQVTTERAAELEDLLVE
jgi:uncharacterized protein YecT (DUF1311 family)